MTLEAQADEAAETQLCQPCSHPALPGRVLSGGRENAKIEGVYEVYEDSETFSVMLQHAEKNASVLAVDRKR